MSVELKGYANQKEALKAKDFTNKRAYRTKSQTRAKVEHLFSRSSVSGAMPKVRYRGLAKNANRLFAMLALIHMEQTAQCIGAFRMRQGP